VDSVGVACRHPVCAAFTPLTGHSHQSRCVGFHAKQNAEKMKAWEVTTTWWV